MIKRLIDKLLGKPTAKPALGKRVEVPASEHGIDPTLVDERAARVVATLKEAGHEAYIVGGAVRDLLLGHRPKDFDVATDATPEQVKSLFRRAFIIGRRFRLVHVHAGPEPIEVSTFRAAQTGDDTTDEHGRLLSDNVYGSQAEDAVRRDFTINALYFDPATETVWAYVGGLNDIRARRLRL